MLKSKTQSGFTLMEIVVATVLFAIVVSSILALFTYVLRVNRKVQAVRQVSQASRNFMESLSREIRNGQISYQQIDQCKPSDDYFQNKNQRLAIVTYQGEKICLYLDSGQLYIAKVSATGTDERETINPAGFSIDGETFRFIVKPNTDPLSSNQGIQPMVTIMANLEFNKGTRDETIIPYQTTISTDVYDLNLIPHL